MSSLPWISAFLIFISFYQVCHGGCSSDLYRCRNGNCVKWNYVCDGDDDCKDQSDENICGPKKNRQEVLFLCRSRYYISKNRACDGSRDCDDGTDEENCGSGYCGSPELFRCGNGLCIRNDLVCDGARHCADGSDEQQCGSGTCDHPVLFKCGNGTCISKTLVCDQVNHCIDGADEKQCGTGISALNGVEISRLRGISWLKSKRSNLRGWDQNTHRAMTALYLANAVSFDGIKEEEELTVKQLELEIALRLLWKESTPVSLNEMALYINALLVTCHNPRNFYGFNLVNLLKQMIQQKRSSIHPMVYLALCNANETLSTGAVQHLLAIANYDSQYLFWTDIQAMAAIALSCVTSQNQYYEDLSPNVTLATTSFKQQQRIDGSFGNVYTTALVVQALLATGNEDQKDWDLEGAIKYLQSKQSVADGYSFGDFLATYLTLPIMNRKSFADIANVKCTGLQRHQRNSNSSIQHHVGSVVSVTYSLYIGDDKKVIHPIHLKVPSNVTVQDVMDLAAEADSKYRYEFKRSSKGLYIYSIAGITNDPEKGKFWLMHLGNTNSVEAALQIESPEKIFIKGGEHIIMWYKTANIEP